VIHHNNPVFPSGDGAFRAGLDAGRIIAVPASVYLKGEVRFATVQSWPDFLNPDKFDTISGFVFLFARHFTGFTTPT
jgi:hypothetical protein